ncbi:hypothetical protein ABZW47_31350 [Streptomyces sp. NPDC004549]|uniref:hypothetical protein n=1 Tax=Streptomyces sp. NPDC004549 TaxID=3154283 RepID=UPI0033BDE918
MRPARTAAVVDPGLPAEARQTVHRLARHHPQVLRDPQAKLPSTVGYDRALLVRGLWFTLITGAGLSGWFLLMRRLPGLSVSTTLYVIATVGYCVVDAALLLSARVPGGRKKVAEDLTRARGHYLLRGDDLTSAAWGLVVRASQALELVLVSTWLLSSVDVDRDALEHGVWATAQALARNDGTATAETFAASLEMYAQRIEEANQIEWGEPGVPGAPGDDRSSAVARALARAESAGAHALAMIPRTAI